MSTVDVQLQELKEVISDDLNISRTPRDWTTDALIGLAMADLSLDMLDEPELTKARLAILRAFKQIIDLRKERGLVRDMPRKYILSLFGRVVGEIDEKRYPSGIQRCAICGTVNHKFVSHGED